MSSSSVKPHRWYNPRAPSLSASTCANTSAVSHSLPTAHSVVTSADATPVTSAHRSLSRGIQFSSEFPSCAHWVASPPALGELHPGGKQTLPPMWPIRCKP
eukprot:869829-Prorocentrum_minimum.AAC.6